MHRCVCVAGLDTNNLYMEVYQKYSRGHAESLIKHPNRSVQFIENISLDEMLFFFPLCTSSELPSSSLSLQHLV